GFTWAIVKGEWQRPSASSTGTLEAFAIRTRPSAGSEGPHVWPCAIMSFGMASSFEEPMADSSASLRPWIIPALVLSIAFHGGLFYAASQKTLARFGTSDQPRLVP